MQPENRSCVITGGASGLGAGTVRLFHAAGARVVIADINAAAGAKLATELGERAVFQRTDVTAENDAKDCIDLAVSRFGGLQVLVNCAGIGMGEKVIGKDGLHRLQSFARTIEINLIGTFNMIRFAAEAMSRSEPSASGERGVIVNTASVAAWDGQIGQAAYSASKGGIVGMTLPIARELARYGIRVVTIAPGLFQTPLMDALPPEVQESLGKSVPFPSRLGRPDEFAAMARHIVENEMLNGASIRLDGALRMAPR
ncbi:putative enzyme [Burkholderiales bacterium]|jgi:NAD(P)-dependent dehydrogenase (short-subunit alcohol dehydrogenase family)|nr:putative enzyme [Burkholderiales bacterium]